MLVVALGITSGLLVAAARRWPGLAWVAFAPLGIATIVGAPIEVGIAAALAGAIGIAPSVMDPVLRGVLPLATTASAVSWGLGFAALACARSATSASPVWIAVALPIVSTVVLLPLRVMGAPRWVSSPLACSQERWLAIVHTARGTSDLVTHALIATSGAASCAAWLAIGGDARAAIASGVSALIVALGIALGALRLRRAKAAIGRRACVRVAAVVVDGEGPSSPSGPLTATTPESRDVAATAERYAPHVVRAAALGARIVVLPEVAVTVDDETRARWLELVTAWADAHELVVVAPFFDLGASEGGPKNTLAIVDRTGVVARYDKQHPGRGLEPDRAWRTPPGPHVVAGLDVALSTVICVDLDYGDLVPSVRRSRGLLLVPSNDWPGGFDARHHDTAVWSAVLTGVTTLRATGHGISSVRDGAGRVLAQASSADGPVVLAVDAPI